MFRLVSIPVLSCACLASASLGDEKQPTPPVAKPVSGETPKSAAVSPKIDVDAIKTALRGRCEVFFEEKSTRKTKGWSYKTVWVFAADGSVMDERAKDDGRWELQDSGKKTKVMVYWENKDKSWEEIPVPFKPSNVVGKTWHGPKVRFAMSKIVEK
jgi:hypothetical protein